METRDDTHLSFILEGTSLNCGYCCKSLKRLHNLQTDAIGSKQVRANLEHVLSMGGGADSNTVLFSAQNDTTGCFKLSKTR